MQTLLHFASVLQECNARAVFTYTLSRRNLIVVVADKEVQDDVALRNRRREVVRMEVTILNSGRRTQVG